MTNAEKFDINYFSKIAFAYYDNVDNQEVTTQMSEIAVIFTEFSFYFNRNIITNTGGLHVLQLLRLY